MNRRRFLAATGISLAGVAGCLGGTTGDGSAPAETTTEATTRTTTNLPGPRHGDDLPADSEPTDGFPPQFEEVPPAPSVDSSSFETVEVDGESVPLAPIDVTYAWYARGEARFADARGMGQYERSRVFGAVSSPAGTGVGDGPVADWPTDDRIICYCGCPHHLSSMRAAELLGAGYENVYVIDEGFWEWHGRRYPMAGNDIGASPAVVMVDGVVDAAHAGEYARASHPPTGQVEAARIGQDGRYRLELRFSGVESSSPVVVATPAYEVTAPMGDLAAGVVHGD